MRGFQIGFIYHSSMTGSADMYIQSSNDRIFLVEYSPYEISKSGDKISNIYIFKIDF